MIEATVYGKILQLKESSREHLGTSELIKIAQIMTGCPHKTLNSVKLAEPTILHKCTYRTSTQQNISELLSSEGKVQVRFKTGDRF